jgi:hypothetical protein
MEMKMAVAFRKRQPDDRPAYYRFCEAYLAMAERAKYRPAAPSDGCGHITISAAALAEPGRLEREAGQYAAGFLEEEDNRDFRIGCSDYRTNRALVYVIEAARNLCCGHAGNLTAVALLRMAIADVLNVEHERGRQRLTMAR